MPVILIAEHETVIRLDMASFLEERDHDVFAVDCAEDAIARLASRPDTALLIVSVNLRGSMNGIELISEAKKLCPDINVILATSRSRSEVGNLPFDVTYLAKPFSQREIEAAVSGASAR